MRHLAILLMLTLAGLATWAAPVDRQTALVAGTHFLQQKGLMKSTEQLTCYEAPGMAFADKSFYVFNLDTTGFVIVSADDRCLPILGYSMNGSFDFEKLPINLLSWLQEGAASIQEGIQANAPDDKYTLKQWEELLKDNGGEDPSPKSDSYLLTSTWEQGSGYNNYCPTMGGQHVVVGCVATAMAQIIRYYGTPTRGFGRKQYQHTAYGVLAVDFDTTEYDYSLMPDKIRRSSSNAQKDMVSRFCYHCGIVVNMEYQHSGHTTGSGAHTENVPEGLLYFGYTNAKCYSRYSINNDSLWIAMIHEEIDNLRPIEYSGYGDEGGHAFVLDGYNNSNQFHFNWGWGGYADGFYSLNTMAGFTSNHSMVINIYPSGWDGHLTHFLVSPDGDGTGINWASTNKDIDAAVKLNKLVNRDIWLKEGTYYGDTNSEYAYNFNSPATLYGGFAGTENSLSQLDPDNHPTLFDGKGMHGVLYANLSTNGNKQLNLRNIILQNGYSAEGSVVNLMGEVYTRRMTVRNCQSDSGVILYANSCHLIANSIHDNKAPVIGQMQSTALRQSMVFNNDGTALELRGPSRVVNSDIVSNLGTGISFKHPKSTFINNIVWNNEVNLQFDTTLADTCIRHCAIEGEPDAHVIDSSCLWLNSSNEHAQGPRFIQPSTQRGTAGYASTLDWHLNRRSVCIDAGERLRESLIDNDYDLMLRCRNGVIDLGCYESNYPVSIESRENASTALSIYPNPARTWLTVSHCGNGLVKVYDLTGREVLSATPEGGSARLDVSQLPQGMYFLQSGESTVKLVKQ